MTKVTVHTRSGCHWCDKWKQEEQDWVPPYWNLEKVDGGVSAYPTFVISVGTASKTLVGFKTIPEIQAVIQELKDGSADED